MPIADIVIAVAVVISILIGFIRGFVKEAMSIAALLFAIWAALRFGSAVGELGDSFISSEELRVWFGRILIFIVIITLGGLLSWGVAKLVRLTVLSGTDRALGMAFGFCRGAVLVAVAVMAGQFSAVDRNDWWQDSKLIPYAAHVADWLRAMAPKGMEMIQPDKEAELPMKTILPLTN